MRIQNFFSPIVTNTGCVAICYRGREEPRKNFSLLCYPASEWKHNGSYKTIFLGFCIWTLGCSLVWNSIEQVQAAGECFGDLIDGCFWPPSAFILWCFSSMRWVVQLWFTGKDILRDAIISLWRTNNRASFSRCW